MAEKDINDAFDDILLSEERLNQQGYEEGFIQGKKEGNPEGYHLGYHRGAELGAELGYYLGVVKYYVALEGEQKPSEKINNNLQQLITLIEEFPKTNDENYDILAQADVIRARYRKTCSLLKIDSKFPDSGKISF